MPSCAILFVKNPEPGKVKTRLQSHCSPEQAAQLYRAFILDSAAALAACSAQRKIIAYAPAHAAAAISELVGYGDFELVPQPEADLGQRLECLLEWSFAEGADRSIVLGSDSPSLPSAYIDRALALLGGRDVVLGPSSDGGYYLLGMCRLHRALFTEIAWSTGAVLEQTLARLGSVSLGLLPIWYDVDTPSEAGLLKVHLEALNRAGDKTGENSLEVLRNMVLPSPS